MNGSPSLRLLDERRAALARIVSDLNHALNFVRDAQHINHLHALGLDLPGEKPLVDAITAACALNRHQETA